MAKDAALAAFASSKPGRPRSPFEVELEAERARRTSTVGGAEGDGGGAHLGAGKIALGLSPGPIPARVDSLVKERILKLVDAAVAAGWAHTRARETLGVADVRVHRWRAHCVRTARWSRFASDM